MHKKTKPYADMSDEDLAKARIARDKQIAALREEKKAIQDEVDARYVPPEPRPADHVIGGPKG